MTDAFGLGLHDLMAGELSLAVGVDPGGAVRIAGACCGLVAMKPTDGLLSSEQAMRGHVGVMTGSVADNARALEVLTHAGPESGYTDALSEGIEGRRIAVVREGFGWRHSEADIDAAVRDAATVLARMGAQVDEVSIPMHRMGQAIGAPMPGDGGLPQRLCAAYDDVLSLCDALLMPTVPTLMPCGGSMAVNTAPFNATGHPALQVPCGPSHGPPIGLMLIGRHFDESTLYLVASAFEAAHRWND